MMATLRGSEFTQYQLESAPKYLDRYAELSEKACAEVHNACVGCRGLIDAKKAIMKRFEKRAWEDVV